MTAFDENSKASVLFIIKVFGVFLSKMEVVLVSMVEEGDERMKFMQNNIVRLITLIFGYKFS